VPGELDVRKPVFSLPSGRAARIAGQAAVLSVLVGGTAAYATNDNTVQLTVDGKTSEVSTFGSASVEEVLAEADVEVGDRDLVAPSLDTEVGDGSEVVVQYARRLVVTVDGEERTYWTTALTVDEALEDLDLRADGAWISASRSSRVDRSGLELEMLTPKDVTVVADGATTAVTSTSRDVTALLDELGIVLDADDTTKVPGTAPLADGMVVDVDRISVDRVTETVSVPPPTTEQKTDDLLKGQTKVVSEGTAGTVVEVWRVSTIDGVVTGSKKISSTQTVAPKPKVVQVGTKVKAATPAPAPSPSSSSSSPSPSKPSSPPVATGSVWDRLAQCESGGNWSINTGNGYYGGLQFNLGTWRAYGGTGYPHENSRETQIAVATRLHAERGFNPWPACADKLGLR
jgi:uncharacterized protein YabE (DUF348 family)